MLYQPKLLETRKSSRGFIVVPVHFRHDPEKDTAWEAKERAKYASEAEANRELDFDTREVLGTLAYPSFVSSQHVTDGLRVIDTLPISLAVDFNVSPMVWEVCQVARGSLFIIDEIVLDPADVGMMMQEFRNRYPAHRADIYVYGDATGSHRSPQSLQSCYDEMQIAFTGYPSPVHHRVPISNPPVRDRLSSFNMKLKGQEGRISLFINRQCKMLIDDCEEVILEKGGNAIRKTSNPTDPYSKRTHASDAVGYLIHREWPIIRFILENKKRSHHKKMQGVRRYRRIIGSV